MVYGACLYVEYVYYVCVWCVVYGACVCMWYIVLCVHCVYVVHVCVCMRVCTRVHTCAVFHRAVNSWFNGGLCYQEALLMNELQDSILLLLSEDLIHVCNVL